MSQMSVAIPAHSSIKVTEFHVKDFWSAMTHFIGFVMSFCASLFLIEKSRMLHSGIHLFSMAVFASSLMLLYAASTCYHTFDLSESKNKLLKKIDHCMISVLIAGSYTPVCLLVLPQPSGAVFLSAIWLFALAGIVMKLFWVFCPRWVSSVLYLCMGWACAFVVPTLFRTLPLSGFLWLLSGGLFYTAGGVIYALKMPKFNEKHKNFGTHEIFHLFVMAGSFCHFVLMYSL